MALIFGCSTIVVAFSLISLAFLIIATITAPATNAFGLAEAESIRYGVFGYCSTTSFKCVTGSPSYDVTSITNLTDWKMDDNARGMLVKILIVTPVAAGLTLVSFLFNFFAHFRVFGESFAFYLIGFFFTLLAFLSAALTVIVTFLLFYPHVKWPAWVLIGSAVLNLISVPLVFFAMRTSPRSGSADDDYDSGEDKNLTDLSDGDNFKHAESFKLNEVPSTNMYSQGSTEKFQPGNPAIKVVTEDSSLSGDHFEKVSMQDYSRANDSGNNAYRRYGYEMESANPPSSVYSEGTPNLVSSRNYNKGGAVRTEAPAFLPQTVKTETATPSAYPSAQYGTQYPAPSHSAEVNVPVPASGLYGQDSASMNSQQNSTQRGGYHNAITPSDPTTATASGTSPYPISIFQSRTDSSNLRPSVPQSSGAAAAAEDVDYDNDINDNDSDFTSVSQRAANPRYYRTFQQGPSLFPEAPQDNQYLAPPLQTPQPVQPQRPSGSSYNNAYSPQPQQASYQQTYAPPVAQKPTRDTSDYLLAHNPDFAVGGAAFQKPFTKKGGLTPPSSSGYRPAYKKRINSGSMIPAASLSSDSPYNIR